MKKEREVSIPCSEPATIAFYSLHRALYSLVLYDYTTRDRTISQIYKSHL
jgi:hypothetical protein